MRAIPRLPEPQILVDKGKQWLSDLIKSGAKRPDPTKYRNPAIRLQLNTMSFHKCFYCEAKLKDKPKEVDHHIEVSIDLTLSYVWNNLCLACDNCNKKLDHKVIPIDQALDPCINIDVEIQEHLTFIDEEITARNGSQIGLNTIRKYRLDSELLDKRRITQLKYFLHLINQIRLKQIKDGGRSLNPKELSAINRFKQVDQPYSLMFKVLIDNLI